MDPEGRVGAGTVDTELQESISSLVAALGGIDSHTGIYKFGDEALSCLRDLRKWLQFYDAKYDRQEVACAIANTTLIVSDIPQILGLWEGKLRKIHDPYLDRIALACLELLVPLTWPIDLAGKEATAEHFMQSTFLKKAQKNYKTALLTHESHGILRAIIRIAVKSSLSTSYHDRDPRDEGILTLVCSFFRNLLAIDTGEDDDRAITISEFNHQKVLGFFTTVGSTMGSFFDTQDVLLLESLYYMLRGIDVKKVYDLQAEDEPMQDLFKQDLQTLLSVEAEMNRNQFKPTRHSRFGTMVSMNDGSGENVSISGQRAVANMESTLTKLDDFKKWNKPKYRGAADEREKTSYIPSGVPINSDLDALKLVKAFTSEFLDSSFNPLFIKLRKQIERQQARIGISALVYYCYMVGWFLDAENSRAESEKRAVDYRLIGGALTTSSFVTALAQLRRSLEPGVFKSTDLAHASMSCFRQILTTVQSMSYCLDEELRDVAEGMKSRLFYEESWLSMLAVLPRTSKGKSLAYASETVALTHVVLKMLEGYSKQHTVVFVKSRSKAHNSGNDDNDDEYDSVNADSSAHKESIRVTNERRFSFEKFLMKYVNEQTISTYERVLSNYRQVSQETILQVFSFFRKTFAKTSAKAVFYRISLMHLLLELTEHRGLAEKSKSREVAEEFMRYYVHKFATTVASMPSLHIQTNSLMTPGDAFYYDHAGVEKIKYKQPKHEWSLTSRASHKFSPERQFSVIVAALVDSGKEGSLRWIEETLMSIIQDENEEGNNHSKFNRRMLTSNKDKIKMIHNDGLLRLLLRTMGLYVNTAAGQVYIPSTVDELDFIQKLEWLGKYQKETVEFDEGRIASDYIKIEGSHDYDDSDDEGELRPMGRNSRSEQLNADTPSSANSVLQNNPIDSPNTTIPITTRSKSPRSTARSATSPTITSPSASLAKRTHSYAFDFNVSDDELEQDVPQTIASFTRRKLFVDDDDEEVED